MPTKVAGAANAVPPEPWRSFLHGLDRQLKDVGALRCLGGFVVTQQYGIGRHVRHWRLREHGDLGAFQAAGVACGHSTASRAGR